MVVAILRAWEEISHNTFDAFILTLPQRMKAVIRAKGGSTRS